jgi:7,8-dihydropterin-6-yl-methyl-4-(beta-D-ribofuranosyl)aminobenzene 5'-phosphate synthase
MKRSTFAILLAGALAALPTALATRFVLGRRRAERVWAESQYPKIQDLGTVHKLSVLPLIDWYTGSDELSGEPGVSYLVRADDTTILFDVGLNVGQQHPSNLLRNMEALGVAWDDVDALMISHPHVDHLGGMQHVREGTFAPSAGYVDLHNMPAYVPVELDNPQTTPTTITEPTVLFPGVASMGPIPRQLFFLGWTPEQSLAVHVKGKGIVLIIGCGHPTLQRILERAEMLFDEPIYGIIGGLHYPVTASRSEAFGLPAQMFLGTGKWPWDPINEDDVNEAIASLQARKPDLVSLSPHDSCDWSLNAFRQAFGPAYQDLLVGEEIIVTADAA